MHPPVASCAQLGDAALLRSEAAILTEVCAAAPPLRLDSSTDLADLAGGDAGRLLGGGDGPRDAVAPLGLGSVLVGLTVDGTPLGQAAAGLIFEVAAAQLVAGAAAVFPLDVDALVGALPDASYLIDEPAACTQLGLAQFGLQCGSRLSWLPTVDAAVARDDLLASLRAGSDLDSAQLDALEQVAGSHPPDPPHRAHAHGHAHKRASWGTCSCLHTHPCQCPCPRPWPRRWWASSRSRVS